MFLKYAFIAAAVAGLGAFPAYHQLAAHQTRADAPNAQAAYPGRGEHVTRDAFKREVGGLTKEQVRARFGDPIRVWTKADGDSWTYATGNAIDDVVHVEDPASGAGLYAAIQFDSDGRVEAVQF